MVERGLPEGEMCAPLQGEPRKKQKARHKPSTPVLRKETGTSTTLKKASMQEKRARVSTEAHAKTRRIGRKLKKIADQKALEQFSTIVESKKSYLDKHPKLQFGITGNVIDSYQHQGVLLNTDLPSELGEQVELVSIEHNRSFVDPIQDTEAGLVREIQSSLEKLKVLDRVHVDDTDCLQMGAVIQKILRRASADETVEVMNANRNTAQKRAEGMKSTAEADNLGTLADASRCLSPKVDNESHEEGLGENRSGEKRPPAAVKYTVDEKNANQGEGDQKVQEKKKVSTFSPRLRTNAQYSSRTLLSSRCFRPRACWMAANRTSKICSDRYVPT